MTIVTKQCDKQAFKRCSGVVGRVAWGQCLAFAVGDSVASQGYAWAWVGVSCGLCIGCWDLTHKLIVGLLARTSLSTRRVCAWLRACALRVACVRVCVCAWAYPRVCGRMCYVYISPTTKHTFAFTDSQLHNASALHRGFLVFALLLYGAGLFLE